MCGLGHILTLLPGEAFSLLQQALPCPRLQPVGLGLCSGDPARFSAASRLGFSPFSVAVSRCARADSVRVTSLALSHNGSIEIGVHSCSFVVGFLDRLSRGAEQTPGKKTESRCPCNTDYTESIGRRSARLLRSASSVRKAPRRKTEAQWINRIPEIPSILLSCQKQSTTEEVYRG